MKASCLKASCIPSYFILALGLLAEIATAEVEINTTLMHYTYRIEGPTGKPNEVAYGTGFIMGIPDPNRPGKGRMVLVTAAHVLEKVSGEKASIHLRQKLADGRFNKVPYELQIRGSDKPLWVRHPSVDVAVMKVVLPAFVSKQSDAITGLSTDLLADDNMIEKYEIHPGDQLCCLGYPLGAEANEFGFAILRSGRIASYPLTPAKETKSFLYDFAVFQGNSGGPVYFVDRGRYYGGTIHMAETIQFVAGIVTEEKYQPERSIKIIENTRDKLRYEFEERRERLELAVVVPAHFIKETLTLLDKHN